jgi:hypothetical protein
MSTTTEWRAAPQPGRATRALRAIYIIWYRDLIRFWRDRARLIASMAQPLLYLLVFGTGAAIGLQSGLLYLLIFRSTGAMLIGTVLDELERRGLGTGLVTMCAAGGMAPAIIAPRALQNTSWAYVLPYMTVLAVAALGQMLVIMHAGIDLSTPGVMSFASLSTTVRSLMR